MGPSDDDHPSHPDPLQHAVDEAARLLHADGAIAYLLDAESGSLHWAADAGISASDERAWMRSMVVPLGVGMHGSAAADRSMSEVGDFLVPAVMPTAPTPPRRHG